MDMTPEQLSRHLGVDDSTLRRWARHFSDYLSPKAHRRRRRYTPEDVAVLGRVKGFIRAGKSAEAVYQLLSQPDAAAPEFDPSLKDVARQVYAVRALAGAVTSQIGVLQTGMDENRALIDTLERELAWHRLPWWKRILTPRP